MQRILALTVTLLIASAALAEDNCCPAPQPAGAQVAQAEMPAGHPPIGDSKMPPGHPPVGQSDLPAGHPPVGGLPAGHPPLPAGHPPTSQPATSQPAELVNIAVRAVLGTKDAPMPAGARVILNLVQNRQVVGRRESMLDQHGVVVFEAVPASVGVTPHVAIMHHSVGYQAAGKPIAAGAADQQVDVTVYETTTTAPAWTIAMRHVMVSPDEQGITVTDVLSIENPGDRTWIAEDHEGHPHPTLVLPLPPGATDVQPTGGFFAKHTHVQDGKVVTSTPVTAGRSDFALVYRLAPKAGQVELPILTPAQTKAVRIFLPGKNESAVTSVGLTDEGVKEMGSARVRVLSAADVQPGQAAALTIKGFAAAAALQPASDAAAPGSKAPQVVAGVGVLGALVAGIVMMLARKPAQKA